MNRLAMLAVVGLVACGGTSTATGRRDVTLVTVGGPEGGTLRVRNDDPTTSAIIALPLDKVWAVLPAAFDSLGVTVNVLNAAQRQVGSDGFKVRQRIGGVPISRYFDCGTTQVGANADSYEVILVVLAQLKTAPANTTTIDLLVSARARPVAFSQGYSACQSQTTTLNARLTEIVRRLASR